MSRLYETTVTLAVDGDERDVQIRAYVMYERQRGGSWGGSIDGDVEALVGGAWVSLDDLVLDVHDRERAEDALCEECSSDDRDAERYAS